MKRKFTLKAADGTETVKEYGSTLGDFLRGQRMEIATAEAGEGGDPDAGQAALAEELAAACEMTIEQWAQVESGALDPDDTKCAAIAAVLGKHGVEVTADHLVGLRDADAPEDEQAAEEDAAQTEAAKVKDEALAAAQAEATEMRAKFGASQEAHAQLVAQVAADAQLVQLGKSVLTERRADILKRVALRGTVTDAFKATVESASAEQLEALSSAFGLDPLADPMCKACGVAKAVPYRSSEAATDDQGRPRATAGAAGRTRDRNALAKAISSLRETEDDLSFEAARDRVSRMDEASFWSLHDGVK